MEAETPSLHHGSGNAPARPATPSRQSLADAAQWYATLRDDKASEADRSAWQAWLTEATDHAAAWAHIESISRRFEPLRGFGPGGSAAAVAGYGAARSQRANRRRVLASVTGAVGLCTLGWASWRHSPLPDLVRALGADHHTGTGESRDLILADGTRVWLNTRTALTVDYQASHRRLVLLGGEVLIQTAADTRRRPFYVETDHGRLEALGTRFTVRQTREHTRLDVFEQVVRIRNQGGQTLSVDAGHSAVFDSRTLSGLQPADRLREGWSRGKLLADNIALGNLLDEIGRYRHGRIRVAPAVADIRVMGVYPANDPDRALRMLEETLPIRVHRTLPWWITVEAR